MHPIIEKLIEDNKADELLIKKFAFLGKDDVQTEYFNDLIELAEEEPWSSSEDRQNDILFSYIANTFDKAARDGLVLFTEGDSPDYACFNTGLLTERGEDIICLFNKFSSDVYPYHLNGFVKASDRRLMMYFSETPTVVSYFQDASKLYFDPMMEVVPNLDHIITDNFERFPEELKIKGEKYIGFLMNEAVRLTLTRCKRNYRIAVPQYYRGEITYLLPVDLDGHKLALALELLNDRYRANTIFTLDMAYKNARLLMKPEADWLELNNAKEGD